MTSSGIFCKICSKCWGRSSVYPGRCSSFHYHVPDVFKLSKICRSGWSRKCLASCKRVYSSTSRIWSGIILLKNKAAVLQKKLSKNSSQNSVNVPLCCKCASHDHQRVPAIKENTPHNSTLRACLVFISEKRVGTCSGDSPYSMIVKTQLEAEFVAKDYTSPVRIIST